MTIVALGDICEFIYGRALPKTKREMGPVPVYGSNGIIGTHTDPMSRSETIIIGRKGSVGELNYSSVPCWPIDTTYYIDRSSTTEDIRWLFYALHALRLPELNKATGVPGLNRNDAYERTIFRPSPEEQRRIAIILDRADAIRCKRKEAIALVDDFLKSVFLEMFGDPVTNDRQLPSASLAELTIKITDGEHKNPEFVSPGMPIVMAKQVQFDKIDIDQAKCVSIPDGNSFRKKCNPESGDILIVGRGATIGRCCAVDIKAEFCLMGSVILVKPNNQKILSRYLLTFLTHPGVQAKLLNTSSSSAQQAIYLSHLREMKVLVPTMADQLHFEKLVESMLHVRLRSLESLQNSENLFASLSQRAFRGEL